MSANVDRPWSLFKRLQIKLIMGILNRITHKILFSQKD